MISQEAKSMEDRLAITATRYERLARAQDTHTLLCELETVVEMFDEPDTEIHIRFAMPCCDTVTIVIANTNAVSEWPADEKALAEAILKYVTVRHDRAAREFASACEQLTSRGGK